MNHFGMKSAFSGTKKKKEKKETKTKKKRKEEKRRRKKEEERKKKEERRKNLALKSSSIYQKVPRSDNGKALQEWDCMAFLHFL